MGGDILSLRVLVVSDNEAEREMLRLAASLATVPVELVEITDGSRAAATVCEALARTGADLVFLDSGVSLKDRQTIRDAADTTGDPTAFVMIGETDSQPELASSNDSEGGGVLARPLDPQVLRSVIARCARARLPSRILIVDDSSTVRAVIRKVLSTSRYRIEADEADKGRGALAFVAQRNYDLVFLDCNMPDLDGFATLAELRRSRPDLKVVMISGTGGAELTAKAQAAGARELLVKPFYARDIDDVLSRLYSLEPSRAGR